MLFRLLLIAAMALPKASSFSPSCVKSKTATALEMSASSPVDRRTVFANAVSAAVLLSGATPAAFALNSIPADNEIVKEQRQIPNKLDVNNSPVGDYMKYPGLYPAIGGKIANNGPYKSVEDALNLKILTSAEKAKLKEYKSQLVATPATGLDTLRGRDPYRASFNQYKEVKANVQGS